jgi:predicted Fe-S protein YdhL (DUF1289 family)
MTGVVDSPCISVCVVDPKTGYCIGCGRTTAEISGWRTMDAAARADVRAELDALLAAMTSRRVRATRGERADA